MSKVTLSDVITAVNKAFSAGVAGQAYQGLMPSAHDAAVRFVSTFAPGETGRRDAYLKALMAAAKDGFTDGSMPGMRLSPDGGVLDLDASEVLAYVEDTATRKAIIDDTHRVYVEGFQAGASTRANWTPWLIGIGAAAAVGIGAVVIARKKNPSYASNPRIQDPERCRKIVKLAAKKSGKFPSIKHWFEFDEKGVWELEADRLLEVTKTKAIEMGLTESQVDDQLAEGLKLMALEAELSLQMRKKGKKNPAKKKGKTFKPFKYVGDLVDLIGTQGGNLILRPTANGVRLAKEMFEDGISGMNQMLDSHIIIGGWEVLQPEEVGALTEGTIITREAVRNDFGDLKKVGRVYWHERYQIEDPIEVWAKGKDVFFQGA